MTGTAEGRRRTSPTGPPTPARLAPWALVTLWAAAIVYLTLTPSANPLILTKERFFCVGCGWRGTADIILNWLMFVPGGFALAAAIGFRRALGLAALFTLTIEIGQTVIPGREPALQDLVFNTLGAAAGAWFARSRRIPGAPGSVFAGVILAWLAPAALLVPMPPDRGLFGQWTPDLGNLFPYEGRVLAARVDGSLVASRRFGDRQSLREALAARRPVSTELVVGPPPPSLSPIFSIYDDEQEEVFMLAALGEDLVVRERKLARVLGFDQPDARWAGALTGVESGDTITVVVERAVGSICASVEQRRRCGLAPGPGDGWAFLLNLEGASTAFRVLLSALWSLALGVSLGMAAADLRRAAAVGGTLAAAGLLAGVLSPDLSPDLLHASLLLGGALVGTRLVRTADRALAMLVGEG